MKANDNLFSNCLCSSQVRDLLLKKIPFSGETAEGWEMGKGTKRQEEAEKTDGEEREEASKDNSEWLIVLPVVVCS